MNYFSLVKTWVCSHNPQELAFHAYEIKLMKRAIFKCSEHIPKQAPPITPQQFTAIIHFLTALNPPPRVLITALLVGYLTMLCQSNLVCHSINPSQNPYVLLYQDIKLIESAVIITVRSTKTRRSEKPLYFQLQGLQWVGLLSSKGLGKVYQIYEASKPGTCFYVPLWCPANE